MQILPAWLASCTMSVWQTQGKERWVFSLCSIHKIPSKYSNWPGLGHRSIPGPITVARRKGIMRLEASSNLRDRTRGGRLREKGVLSSEGAAERMTGQTDMIDVHSKGSDSKGVRVGEWGTQ